MATEKLGAVAQEKALVPGTELEIEYQLVSGTPYLVAMWLGRMEARLAADEPLWAYLGYDWNPDSNVIVFRLRLRQYQMDAVTGEIIPLDPATLEPVGQRVTPYYASAGYTIAVIGAAMAAVAGFTFATFMEVRRRTQIILDDPDLTAEQKAEILKDDSVVADAAKAAGGMFALVVALAVGYLLFGRS
jgi:hypothetical protein